jgi:hypothetical protein
MLHRERPGPAASLALLAALALAPAALGAGCTLLLVEPACLVGCHANVSAAPAASAAGGAP